MKGNAATLQQRRQPRQSPSRCSGCQVTFARLGAGPRHRCPCSVCRCDFCASCLASVALAGRVCLGTKQPLSAGVLATAESAAAGFVRACRRCQVLSNPNFTFSDLVSLGAGNLRWFLRFTQINNGENYLTDDNNIGQGDSDREVRRLAGIVLERFGPSAAAASSASVSIESSLMNASQLPNMQQQQQPQQQQQQQHQDQLVLSLSQLDVESQLDGLSIKEMKHLLARNRVDYRGCLERTELLDKLRRLWREHECSRLAVERDTVATVDLCKVCMDATIDSVLLECGHMVTCVGCGKRCAECPVCRQNVVRVVRTFKS